MDKKILQRIKLFIIILSLSMIKVVSVKAELTDIYSTEEDGVWRPTDKISKTFKIQNIWGKECYLEGIEFSKSYIKDNDINYKYSIEEAEKENILDNVYNVTITYGEEEIYSGTMDDLANRTINFKEPIFMDLNFVGEFYITIEFNNLVGNDYQNKSYQYILKPNVFVVMMENNVDDSLLVLTKTGEIINKNTLIMVGILTVGGGVVIWFKI
ncbi:hypothetical protein CM240_0134 [Clostridium bornimense]|uniref:Uncharacterized protein n=1 Tax=Clostridium bornimense TaxID=1216932 RepID=W6RSU3_9CLOT|nr:hypothetical protein [Clostridium bornimense]CDM67313.1 hypothetical protein CM240_0134 [Clostridium bornimense]